MFYWRDKIKVINGFFKDSSGYVEDKISDLGSESYYCVKIEKSIDDMILQTTANIKETDMEKDV